MDEEYDINDHLSLRILRFFLRFLGMWPTNNSRDRLIHTLTNLFVMIATFLGLVMSATDLYHTLDDLQKVSYSALTVIAVGIELGKLSRTFIDREEFLNFNTYTQKMFWKKLYNPTDIEILEKCNRKSIKFMITHIIFGHITGFLYIFTPYYESIGRNISDRVLPVQIYLNLPILETPYYQLTLITQGFTSMGIAVCVATYAGYFCIINFYAAGQFRILQNKFHISLNDMEYNRINDAIVEHTISVSSMNIINCIEQHQKLISYMKKVEDLFNMITFFQTFGSILLLCFCSFQLLLSVETSILRIVSSGQFLLSAIFTLFLFAWPSHEIIVESMEVAEAAYQACWYHLPYTRVAMSSRKSLLFVIIRARRPCVLTIGKFTPMSLQTFGSVINTALSYLAVLRQMKEDVN